MTSQNYQLIGLMSGTSGDGLDVALCQFQKKNSWNYEIIQAESIPFPDSLNRNLQTSHQLTALELQLLDVDFGRWVGREVKAFCERHQANPLAVCSHGHTVFHQPQKGLSFQLGNGWAIQQTSGLKVINDFRMKDVQLGGQGAPLVPIGDRELFPEMDFCINLGGISNISMDHLGKRIAFDVSPFNLLLNPIAKCLGAEFDHSGKWASMGVVQPLLLEQLNQLDFYQQSGAKSLGREDIEQDFFPLVDRYSAENKDKLATLTEHYAIQMSRVIRQFATRERPKVLITGGGAYHFHFIDRLDAHLEGRWDYTQADSNLIEFKEALVFAFLGHLRLLGIDNCLASVTGARRDSCGGTIYEN